MLVKLAAQAQAEPNYAIYDTLLKIYNGATPVASTSLRILKEFDFKNLKYHDFNPKDTLNSEWKLFFNSMDISNVQSGNLDSAFLAKYNQKEITDRKIQFTPIIVSSDGTKAICGVYLNKADENMYLFEKKNGKWTFRRSYFVSVE